MELENVKAEIKKLQELPMIKKLWILKIIDEAEREMIDYELYIPKTVTRIIKIDSENAIIKDKETHSLKGYPYGNIKSGFDTGERYATVKQALLAWIGGSHYATYASRMLEEESK